MNFKLSILLSAGLVILLIWFLFGHKINMFYPFYIQSRPLVLIQIQDIELNVEIADTYLKRVRGLSGRENMPDDLGLLFIFNQADYHSFWMKGMKFSIDIIWISQEMKVVSISKNISPESFPKNFSPIKPAKYVLEVKAGWADQQAIEIGDNFVFKNKK